MGCDKAALKLQSGFRGHQARKEVKALKEGENDAETSKTKHNGATEEEFDIDLNDPECDKAALKLQSGFRGHQTRKKWSIRKTERQKDRKTERQKDRKTERQKD